ncbi:hypothetical protein NIES267_27130 [Calothrix parasitica NIES-267]|uniref:Uncharacterized protein n=1 Tax=Calothrix parasitica NIES-267 TaxID=1973488 RepID=A0A1Z4LPS0_9CYAN|nr:hypothetical protein NIES267_27130 [Calothrix parasitica NIES-267]
MAKNANNNFLATRIQNSFSQAWSKISFFNQSKANQDSQVLEDSQSEEYQIDINSQQNLHPYLIDRVEPSVQHIIFSSYIKF